MTSSSDFSLNTHSAAMRQLIAARDWLYVIRLPAYGPDLTPPRVRSHIMRSLTASRHRRRPPRHDLPQPLKRIQCRTGPLNAFVTQTGLTLEPEPP